MQCIFILFGDESLNGCLNATVGIGPAVNSCVIVGASSLPCTPLDRSVTAEMDGIVVQRIVDCGYKLTCVFLFAHRLATLSQSLSTGRRF